MATNINLSAPESAEKKTISGKSALFGSLILLVVVLGAYLFLALMKNLYNSQSEEAASQIEQEKKKMSSSEFSELADFESRLNLLEKAIDDHNYWDIMLKSISSYVLPEVKFSKLQGKKDTSDQDLVEVAGSTTNLDAVSRELVLLKTFPNLDSLEFESASESASESTSEANQQKNINFNVNLKINKKAFQK